MTTTEQSDFREGVPFLGGALWIDLLNTTPVVGGKRLDLIAEPGPLAAWSGLAGISGPAAPSERDVAETKALRETLRPVFDQIAEGKPIAAEVREVVNGLLRQVGVTRQLATEGDTPRLIEQESCAISPAAAAAALDFARFVTDYDPARLRHCNNPACTMVYYDRGKNNRRRWCSMQVCGNRSKVASYRERKAGRDGG